MGNRYLFALAALLLFAQPAIAAPDAVELAAARIAEQRGAEMYAYDQAARLASDRFQADMQVAQLSKAQVVEAGVQGYLVEPVDNDSLQVTFYSEHDGTRAAFARYIFLGGQVSGPGILAQTADRTLSPLALRLAAARNQAAAQLGKPGHEICSQSPPNTIVLPNGNDGKVTAYVMSSTTQAGVYPAGGHFRFDFDESGQLTGERRFMNSCFSVDWRNKDGKQTEMMFLTHLLDSQPTEIHAFVSRNIPIPLAIIIVSKKALWEVDNGHITFTRDIE